ncbi:sigma-E factor negative regulatory protein [Candidatus Thiothrix anitrata]|jgi:sigma-E factor negative regulatory protein RseA|uniref:Sigma-E factor negative regulatory protein n=1 Tax=Candidatus Thiothrix anitrata TaxID=2823902 RepID=A0ABX7X146_9GAMM|nr:sigma-E factor negative regulatory protein [Candidatus Thiothrix anitrata]QTR49595.1 sigma-E factor negative regulatory protein [Candidatus Thiothrix anitrata]
MNTSKTEFLSALLDDEAGEFEQRRLLNELNKDAELGQTLSRYVLIGEAMRAGNSGQRMGSGMSLLARIQDELEAEPVYAENVIPLPVSKPKYSYKTLGMGMAAAIGALTLGGVLFLQPPGGDTQSLAMAPTISTVAMPAVAALPVTDNVDARIQQVGRIDPQTRDILKQYVAQHVKYASTTAIAPSIRAVSYANER